MAQLNTRARPMRGVKRVDGLQPRPADAWRSLAPCLNNLCQAQLNTAGA